MVIDRDDDLVGNVHKSLEQPGTISGDESVIYLGVVLPMKMP
jgi:hypothetical protein